MTKYDHGKHPNSLKNLVEPWGDPDKAREAQKKGVAARKANKEAREKLAITANEWKSMKKEVLDKNDLSSIDVLKVLMIKALDNDDFITAADLAKSLAEFETPKLARIESKIEEIKTDDLTDEELDAKLKELLNDKNNSS